jgi:sensor histidine kinase YesM
MDIHDPNNFLFSPKYRVWRHVLLWVSDILFFSLIVNFQGSPGSGRKSFWEGITVALFIIPFRMLIFYTLMYWAIPKYLLQGRHRRFVCIFLAGVIAGFFLNYLYRAYFLIPLQNFLHVSNINRNPWQAGGYVNSFLTAVGGGIIIIFKHWMRKQQAWLQAEKEKATAELQLLKAQVHPHFLFNTLNNIYSFSLENSPKTPALILKLSSLLSYMLYDCKAEEVLLEKEIEVMKNYIDLEKERYGNKIEISLNIEGDIKDKYIAPLLLLPFLENAFKHGTSEQLEKPWLSVDIAVKHHVLKCKLANSKNEFVPVSQHGIGIQNIKKRLQYLFPDKHELKMNDEGDFFVVSLLIELINNRMERATSPSVSLPVAEKASA